VEGLTVLDRVPPLGLPMGRATTEALGDRWFEAACERRTAEELVDEGLDFGGRRPRSISVDTARVMV
jgi:hypothetical protein